MRTAKMVGAFMLRHRMWVLLGLMALLPACFDNGGGKGLVIAGLLE